MLRKFLYTEISPLHSFSILLLRLTVGITMAVQHGWPKFTNWSELKGDFFHLNVFGLFELGDAPSAALTIFSELICSVLLALGLFTRMAAIPLIITFLVIIFDVHWCDPFRKKEMPLLYLMPYIIILFSGPGKYSLDKLFFGRKPTTLS